MSAEQLTHAVSGDALKGLADIVSPAPISWYPQTWGWWAVGAVLLAALAYFAIRWTRRWIANRYRREALRECAALEAALHDERQRAATLAALPVLLKRVALGAWPRTEVASLSGATWVTFVKDHAGGARIDQRTAGLLNDAEYQETLDSLSAEDARASLREARDWIEHHDVSA
jgi:hypothetical protein